MLPDPHPQMNKESCATGASLSLVRRFFLRLDQAGDITLGFVGIIFSLAVVSAIPILNLLSLGYLLEASARVGKSGRFRDGFIGIRPFAVGARIVIACWLWVLPIRLIDSYRRDA